MWAGVIPHARITPLVLAIMAIVCVPIMVRFGLKTIRRPEDTYRSFNFTSKEQPSGRAILWTRIFGITELALATVSTVVVVGILISN